MNAKFKFKWGPVLITSLALPVLDVLYSILVENEFNPWTLGSFIFGPIIVLMHITVVALPLAYILSFKWDINFFWSVSIGMVSALMPSALVLCFFKDWGLLFSFRIFSPIVFGALGGCIYWKTHLFLIN